MKLKQQIMLDSWDYEFPISNIQANHIVDLAEKFAIGFAYWCEWHNDRAFKTYEELLEIYKKEKEL